MPDNDAVMMQKAAELKPALSATSDKPTMTLKEALSEPTETPKEPVAKIEPVSTESDQAAPEGESTDATATSDTGEETAAKPSKGVQKRIDELTKKAGESERQREALARENEELKRSREQVQVQDDPKPSRNEFDTPDDYDGALALWGGRQALREYQNTQNETTQRTKQQEEATKLQTQWAEGEVKALEKYPDFKETVENDAVTISGPMAYAIPRHPMAHDIAYYFGKNPAEAARIALLGPAESAMEIGAIAYQLKTAKPEVSKAPRPVSAVGTSNSAGRKTPNEESMEEFAARRNSEIRGVWETKHPKRK